MLGTVDDIELLDRIKAIVMRVLELDACQVDFGPSTNLFDLGADSLTIVELFLAMEQEFAFQVGEEDLSSSLFEKVSNLVDFVSAKVAGR
jgi:acyl carrier protein